MKLDETIFRAYDIRGVVTAGFDAPVVRAIGRALGSEARARGQYRIALGRDGRLSGPELSEALSEGLRSAGMEVIDIGCVPTPLLYFAAIERADGNGVMLTGSHNPPDYNGLKMMLAGETLSGEAIQSLRRRIREEEYLGGEGGVEHLDVANAYVDRILEDVRLARPLKVVVDCGNGAAGVLAPRLLRGLGCEVVELFCEIDGNFPNHHPDPSQPENLGDLIAEVQASGADLGLAFDGDGDRLGVTTAAGEIIWPDRLLLLYAEDVLSRHPGAEILFDVKCSGNLARGIEAAGGRAVMWRTGHSLIKARMKSGGSLLAGEMSGHIFFRERWLGVDDALYAAARLLEILARDPRTPAELFASLPDAVNTPELRVEMAEGEHFEFMERFAARLDAFEGAQTTTIDGVRVDYDNGWGLVRASNTTPCLVLRFEADDSSTLRGIQEKFRKLMLGIRTDLNLPF